MTNNRGYIYVLANSAMPDLVKVGKTTRTPAERAAELSKVTGVPTPFIVVYEQLVDDCTAAEEFVHTMLQQKGYRESDNREFFRAPVSEVIQIIIKMPTQFARNSDFEDDEDAEFFSSESDNELDEFVLDNDDFEDEEPDYPWLEVWEMAENYYLGWNDYIEDYDEAMKLYKQAIKLGCLLAYQKIGDMYLYGFGVNESDKKALDWYKEGVKKGNYYCYSNMGDLFLLNGQIENFQKCYKSLFKSRDDKPNEVVERFGSGINRYCYQYISKCLIENTNPEKEIVKKIKPHKIGVIEYLKGAIAFGQNNHPNSSIILSYQQNLKWVEENL
jgi:tetratricopeptide (TPR) repeat protein